MTPGTTDDLIAEIEAAAKDATPGDWTASEEDECEIGIRDECDELVCWGFDHIHDALFVELACPANVLFLLARIRELTAAKATAIAELDADRIYCRERHEAISARVRELEARQIELPPIRCGNVHNRPIDDARGEAYNEALDDCWTAIEAAGVGIRP